MMFNSKVFDEYNQLKLKLLADREVLALVNLKNELLADLNSADEYSQNFQVLKDKYDEVSSQLASSSDYMKFKELERNINLFIMHCNKEIAKLFDLSPKECCK